MTATGLAVFVLLTFLVPVPIIAGLDKPRVSRVERTLDKPRGSPVERT